MASENFKVREFGTDKIPKWKQYADLTLGNTSILTLIRFEIITLLCNDLPGALGLLLRSKLYPLILGEVGQGVVFGRSITFRHPHKIKIGSNTILDDNCVLDAKGNSNHGITLGQSVFIGRNSIIYCKNGDIELKDRANIGANTNIYAKNKLIIGQGTMVAAYTYIMNGGRYDYASATPLADQSDITRGDTIIGENCWIGAKVTIFDGTEIGDNTVIGAGAVVTKNIPANAIAMGLPAKVTQTREHQTKDLETKATNPHTSKDSQAVASP
ncbi:MAG: DapH/DapD/GlmU-related protein [Cyanobacteria bacterium J06649_4]